MKTFFIALIVALAAFAAGVWYTREYNPAPIVETPDITTPATSQETFYYNASAADIVVTEPFPRQAVGNTFMVSGKARGGWYFEANFPYEVWGAEGGGSRRLVEGPVQAQGEWMTSEFVPFSFQVTVPNYKGAAKLVLLRDNPSGLPENDSSIVIPITIQ